MASAQLLQEELQRSVRILEDGADADQDAEDTGADDRPLSSSLELDSGTSVKGDGDEDVDMDGEEDLQEQENDSASGQEDDLGENSADDSTSRAGEEEDDGAFDDDDDDDAEGEDEDEDDQIYPDRVVRTQKASSDDGDVAEDDEDEGVGAVKIKPGESDDDDEADDSGGSGHGSDQESDGSAAWEEVVENGNEEESDNASRGNSCMFCKQDEENDPSEEFEAYLTCDGCGENSHQQCAREHAALRRDERPDDWRCPDCVGEEDERDEDEVEDREEEEAVPRDTDASINGIVDKASPPSIRRATAPKLARDLLPPQKGSTKPDSHSMFNQLVLDEDPMDGSRILRKRKTSSVEADDNIISLRKRRKASLDDQSNDGNPAALEPARPLSSRSLRIKLPPPPATIVEKTRDNILMTFRISAFELRRILSRKPRREKKRPNRGGITVGRPHSRLDAESGASAITAPLIPTPFSQPFYSFYDKETDETKSKPYGGILSETEADTSRTLPTNDDRRRFDEAKQKAEEEWRQRLLDMQAETDMPLKKAKKSGGPASQIECIEFGGWEIDTWYAAPYPEEYSRNRVLYICEFCLKYMNSDYVAWRHKLKCPAKHPPGDEIYRHASVSVFEVDGRKNPVYCQNLCLLAKLFLGSKTLYYDVEPFLFYVLCEYDDLGYHFVGYFSKEKRASSQNNVSCILTLPIHQRKGYGNLLIDFSYLLTRVEQKTGSPEKPLSDMGLVSYRNYWRLVICRYLMDQMAEVKDGKRGLTIKQISDDTGLTPDDVISALEGLRCLVRDSQTQLYAFRVDLTYCNNYVGKWEAKNYVKLNPSALTWTPYVMGRGIATNFELGPALTAIAPREEDDTQKTAVVVTDILVNGGGETNGPATNGLVANGVLDTATSEAIASVSESREVNGETAKADQTAVEETKPNGLAEDIETVNGTHDPSPAGAETMAESSQDWRTAYKDIPAARFEIFPPATGGRRADRSRQPANRPTIPRLPSSVRPRPRRSVGSSRKPPTSKPKSSSKRKTGGTGRGPGRWPKGTKKSDYGNADSGPGFPPGWIAEQNRLASAAEVISKTAQVGVIADNDDRIMDTVEVQTIVVKDGSTERNGVSNSSPARRKSSPASESDGESGASSSAGAAGTDSSEEDD